MRVAAKKTRLGGVCWANEEARMPQPLEIRKPCPRLWEDLQGDERRRFCSECALHVHNSAELTAREAQALVSEAEGRVCMRIEYDPQGAPIHRETRVARLSRWALSAGAALLAACQGGPSGSAGDPKPVQPPSRMGKVVATQRMGDVAVPPERPLVTLGEVLAPAPAPTKPK